MKIVNKEPNSDYFIITSYIVKYWPKRNQMRVYVFFETSVNGEVKKNFKSGFLNYPFQGIQEDGFNLTDEIKFKGYLIGTFQDVLFIEYDGEVFEIDQFSFLTTKKEGELDNERISFRI